MITEVLVSVVIITYNSHEYIVDALNSIFNQTYKKLELIVSDDCSTDNTVTICKKWLEKYGDRFERAIVVNTPQNSGVAINCNNGCKLAKGKWVKLVAGDDLLPENSIEDYLRAISEKGYTTILCAKVASFEQAGKDIRILDMKPDPYTKRVFSLDASKQYKYMLYEYVILFTIGCIISKQLYEDMGYYDESFPYIEDHPFMLKVSRNKIKINYCDSFIGYMHRTNINSASQTRNGMMNAKAFGIGGLLQLQDEMFVIPYISKRHLLFYYHYYLNLFRRYIVIHVMNNRNNVINRTINRFFLLLDPYFIKRRIYNAFHRKG